MIVALVAMAQPASSFAQASSATVQATVVDLQNRAVAGAVVVLTNAGTAQSRDAVAGNDGVAMLAQLPPAAYTATATAPGFGTTQPIALTLAVGDARAVRLVLPLAAEAIYARGSRLPATFASLAGLVVPAGVCLLLAARGFRRTIV
ncbi:MAG: hypothetical protein ABS36_18160 [Acidobacteria bacterium SCN 69-37]|nr:MAG: hypothetical protein ABS36_18160 [Acidobacteria bacterium SCN 69-37]